MIGIVGNGVVGSTLARWLSRHGDVRIYDANPARSPDTLKRVLECDLIFLCIYLSDNASTAEGFNALEQYVTFAPAGSTVVVKSTVMPGTCDALARSNPDVHILFNPEWLTEARPDYDFEHPSMHVIGAADGDTKRAIEVMSLLPTAPKAGLVSRRQAEWLKMCVAGFLASKVSWFNQLYDALGAEDFEAVRRWMGHEPRIGMSHTDVGQDGYRGWGGKCFTKDVPLLAQASKMPLLREVCEYNDTLLAKELVK